MQVQVRGQCILKIAGNVLRGSAATDFFMNRHPTFFAKHCSGVAPCPQEFYRVFLTAGKKNNRGARWKVRQERADALLKNGSITENQFQEFMSNGAIGSHLENLQRKGGFKGFNQHAVSLIIAETDPRKQQAH